jgi:hypothetical protein
MLPGRDRRCGVSVVPSVCDDGWSTVPRSDEVGWLLVGRCRRASPRPDIAFDGRSLPGGRLLTLAARAATLAHVTRLGRRRLRLGFQSACKRPPARSNTISGRGKEPRPRPKAALSPHRHRGAVDQPSRELARTGGDTRQPASERRGRERANAHSVQRRVSPWPLVPSKRSEGQGVVG